MKPLKAIVSAAILAVSAGQAFAQDAQQSCTCRIPLVDEAQSVGQIASGAGEVLSGQANGQMVGAASGEPLYVGSHVVTGSDGVADVSIYGTSNPDNPGCQFSLANNSELMIFATDQDICVAAYQSSPASNSASNSASNGGGGGEAVLALGVVAAGGAAAFALGGGKNSMSAE